MDAKSLYKQLVSRGYIQDGKGGWILPKRVVVRGAQPEGTQPASARPLVGGQRRIPRGKGRVEIIVSLVDCRRTRLDSDSVVGACKHLRDAIADSLGYDDGDERVRWEYGQLETAGEPGVIVRIEFLD